MPGWISKVQALTTLIPTSPHDHPHSYHLQREGGFDVRPPVIPPGVAEARKRRDAGEKRKTEKQMQEENGGAGGRGKTRGREGGEICWMGKGTFPFTSSAPCPRWLISWAHTTRCTLMSLSYPPIPLQGCTTRTCASTTPCALMTGSTTSFPPSPPRCRGVQRGPAQALHPALR